MAKIFITGIAGFIGSHLADRLIGQGHVVSGVDNLSSGKQENLNVRANFYRCDCRDINKLKYIISETKPDFIYHLAATLGVKRVLDDPKECIENNIDSTRNVLSLGIPGIFASTSEVYGKNDKILSEESVLIYSSKSRWSYATSKLIGEFLAQQTPGWKSVRFFNVVGPRQSTGYGSVLPSFVKKALHCEKLLVYGNGKQVRTFLDVRDCAEILDRLRDKYFDVVNIGGDNVMSIYELAARVCDVMPGVLLPTPSKIAHIEYKSVYPDGFEECHYRVPNLAKLEKLLQVIPKMDFSRTILDVAESIKREEEYEQVRQHESDVSSERESTIPRFPRPAIR